MHAAAVIKNNNAYLFFGKSGDGKSTAAKISKRFKVIGDDIIAVKKEGRHYFAFATPWKQGAFIKAGKHDKARIRAMFFLHKSERIAFQELPPAEALSKILYNHVHFFNHMEKEWAGKIWTTAVSFVRQVPAFKMEFKKDADFWPELAKQLKP